MRNLTVGRASSKPVGIDALRLARVLVVIGA
jgi:hypothetical protein